MIAIDEKDRKNVKELLSTLAVRRREFQENVKRKQSDAINTRK
jgi:hypothetical protein